MDFQLSSDQVMIETAVDGLASMFKDVPVDFSQLYLENDELDKQIREAGFFDIAETDDLGPCTAALAVIRLAQLPYTSETALSMLVRPHVLNGGLPQPFGIMEKGRAGRFLPSAKTVIIIEGEDISIAHPKKNDDIDVVPALYAYPYGILKSGVDRILLSETEASKVRLWLHVAMAAEILGLMTAALDCTVEHLSVRKQFGRPLGSFQALQHRLAEVAVNVGALKWLTLRAAATADAGHASTAALYAQENATRLVHDVHQMFGAMGMTLEHPLHLWTYRIKALLSQQGGRSEQMNVVTKHCFPSV